MSHFSGYEPSSEPAWTRIGRVLGQALGILVGIVIFGAACVAPIAVPLLRDNSKTWTCADSRVSDFCGDSYTIGGFVASICGRDNIRFKGTLLEYIEIAADPGAREPDSMRLEMECDGVALAWEATLPEWNDVESVDDIPEANEQTRLAVDLFREYSEGTITLDGARNLLID